MSIDSDDSRSIVGSTLGAFLEAFAFIFVLGSLLIFGYLEWIGNPFIRGSDLYPWLLGYACLSALYARFASFQVSTLVTLSSEGIRAEWRGPFGGHSSQQVRWVDLKEIRTVGGLSPVCSIRSQGSIFTIFLTYAQARAILRDPRCPIKDLSPRLAKRIGLLPKG